MTNIEILRTFNDWRRDRTGNRTLEDFGITPRMIGEALDAVIKDAERLDWLDQFIVSADCEQTGRIVFSAIKGALRECVDSAIDTGKRQ